MGFRGVSDGRGRRFRRTVTGSLDCVVLVKESFRVGGGENVGKMLVRTKYDDVLGYVRGRVLISLVSLD